jgi:hypothetical protein
MYVHHFQAQFRGFKARKNLQVSSDTTRTTENVANEEQQVDRQIFLVFFDKRASRFFEQLCLTTKKTMTEQTIAVVYHLE